MIAAYVNNRINTERSHQYSVTENVHTLYQDITGVKQEGKETVFCGWAFDTEHYAGEITCEILLKDVETEETLWPKMETEPEIQEIPKKYTGEKEISGGSFEGKLKTAKLDVENIYEILLRYTCKSIDNGGNTVEYVRTVTTNNYLSNGEMTNYNPDIFVEPDIKETEIAEKIKNAELFHYFQEGMWVYSDAERLYFIVNQETVGAEQGIEMPVFWYTNNLELLEGREKNYIPNYLYSAVYEEKKGIYFSEVEMPDIPIKEVETGLYINGGQGWVLRCRKPF